MDYNPSGGSQSRNDPNPDDFSNLYQQDVTPASTTASSGTEFWQQIHGFPDYGLEGQNMPVDQSSFDTIPWDYIAQLQGDIQRLEREVVDLRGQIARQENRPPVEVKPERSNSDLTSIEAGPSEARVKSERSPERSASASSTKRRKYTRRPKADKSAPVRPLTAYARFAIDHRKPYADLGLSFADIAKRIGMDWQNLPDDVRDLYLSRASNEKQQYDKELREYQETGSYQDHQEYLASFAAKSLGKGKSDSV